MSWRTTPFEKGATYEVKVSFKSAFSEFTRGSRITFEREDYSTYDSATIYTFVEDGTGNTLQWWHFDSEPADRWEELFKEAKDRVK